MLQHSVPGHDSKDNEQLSNSNERTTKDLPENILFYIREFEKNITKKINVQRGNTSHILIPTYYVETFLQAMTYYYKNICILYPHMNSPVFSDLKLPLNSACSFTVLKQEFHCGETPETVLS